MFGVRSGARSDPYDGDDASGTVTPDGRHLMCTCGWAVDVLVPQYGDPFTRAMEAWVDHAEAEHPVGGER